MNCKDLIEELELTPHPEGGYFKETYRASDSVNYKGSPRAASTAIYYLLNDGAVSHLHRIDADEVWHAYAGSGLRVHIFDEDGYRFFDIGVDLKAGQRPQDVVPAGAWFGAELLNPKILLWLAAPWHPALNSSTLSWPTVRTFLKSFPTSAPSSSA